MDVTENNGFVKKACYAVGMLLIGGMVTFGATSVEKRVSHNEDVLVSKTSVDSLQNDSIRQLQEGQRVADKERRQTLNLTVLIAKQLEVPEMKIEAVLLNPGTTDTL